jgi:phosphopantetheinyl transferase (holo-ACP synthase)
LFSQSTAEAPFVTIKESLDTETLKYQTHNTFCVSLSHSEICKFACRIVVRENGG